MVSSNKARRRHPRRPAAFGRTTHDGMSGRAQGPKFHVVVVVVRPCVVLACSVLKGRIYCINQKNVTAETLGSFRRCARKNCQLRTFLTALRSRTQSQSGCCCNAQPLTAAPAPGDGWASRGPRTRVARPPEAPETEAWTFGAARARSLPGLARSLVLRGPGTQILLPGHSARDAGGGPRVRPQKCSRACRASKPRR